MKTDQEIIEKIEDLGGVNAPKLPVLLLAQFLPKEKGMIYLSDPELADSMEWDSPRDESSIVSCLNRFLFEAFNKVQLLDKPGLNKCLAALMIFAWMIDEGE